jgi:hypothetical protein
MTAIQDLNSKLYAILLSSLCLRLFFALQPPSTETPLALSLRPRTDALHPRGAISSLLPVMLTEDMVDKSKTRF